MQKLSCCLFIFFAIVVNAANDYFDLLQDEFEAKPTGQVRRFYITVEEGIWDYASEMDANANVPGKTNSCRHVTVHSSLI